MMFFVSLFFCSFSSLVKRKTYLTELDNVEKGESVVEAEEQV